MKINSVIFHTSRLSEVRDFYQEKLGLQIGTYVRENQTVPDCSETYVNFHLDNGLYCFEYDSEQTDIATIVLNVPEFAQFKKNLEKKGVVILGGNDNYFKIKDPEGRSLIIEPIR